MPDDRCFRIDDLDVEELRDHTRDQQLIDAFSHWVERFAPRVDEVISEISAAFADMRLDEGIGLFQAKGLDDYASDEELKQLRERDEMTDWKRISYADLERCYPCDGSCGICVDGWEDAQATVFDIDIFGNVVFGCGVGINVRGERGGGVDDVMISNNIVSTVGQGFSLWGAASGYSDGFRTNVKVYNNTFVGQQDSDPQGVPPQFVVRVHPTDLSLIQGFEFKNNIVARDYDSDELFLFSFNNSQNSVPSDTSSPRLYSFTNNLYWENGYPVEPKGTHGEDNVFNANPVFSVAPCPPKRSLR